MVRLKFPKPKNKYNAKKVKSDDGKRYYASKVEKRFRTEYLATKEKAGLVSDIKEQPRVELTPFIAFKPDYFYKDLDTGDDVFTDVKGVETERFRLIKNLWKTNGTGILEIAKFDSRIGLWKIERIKPKPEMMEEFLSKRQAF